MYVPAHFSLQDTQLLHEVIRRYGFGLLISPTAPLEINYAPCLLSAEGDALLFHLAAVNPQCALLQNDSPLTVVFQGPHGYISPRWYLSPEQVPTWNFVTVQVSGRVTEVTEAADKLQIVEALTRQYEPAEAGWSTAELSETRLQRLLGVIRCYRLSLDEVRGKAKLSQNREEGDRLNAIQKLREIGDDGALELADWMQRSL